MDYAEIIQQGGLAVAVLVLLVVVGMLFKRLNSLQEQAINPILKLIGNGGLERRAVVTDRECSAYRDAVGAKIDEIFRITKRLEKALTKDDI